jgi:hypothetical protein
MKIWKEAVIPKFRLETEQSTNSSVDFSNFKVMLVCEKFNREPEVPEIINRSN